MLKINLKYLNFSKNEKGFSINSSSYLFFKHSILKMLIIKKELFIRELSHEPFIFIILLKDFSYYSIFIKDLKKFVNFP